MSSASYRQATPENRTSPSALGAALAAILLAGSGCRDSSATKPSAASASATAASSPASSAKAASGEVTIWVNGEQKATLKGADVTAPRMLLELVPEEIRNTSLWAVLKVQSTDGKRTLELTNVAEDYPNLTPTIYVSEGKLAFSMARVTGEREMPLTDVGKIEVMAKPPEPEGEKGPLKVTLPDGTTRELEVEALKAKIQGKGAGATKPAAGGKKKGDGSGEMSGDGKGRERRNPTWPLSKVVAAVAEGASFEEVVLVDGDARDTVKKSELERVDIQVKVNSAGELRYRRFEKDADGNEQMTFQLDDLKQIILR